MTEQAKIEYEVCCSINWGNTVDSIDTLLKEVNSIFARAGIDAKYVCEGNFRLTLTCNRELNDRENYRMKTVLAMVFIESEFFRNYDIRVESIRSKPGQSRSQSYKATNATHAR